METAAARLAAKTTPPQRSANADRCGELLVGGTYEHNQRFCAGRTTVRREACEVEYGKASRTAPKRLYPWARGSGHNNRFAHGIKHDFRGIVQV